MSGRSLLDRHDAVLFDLDGTVYHGARPIPAAADAVAHVRERGRAVRFVTNNAAKSPAEVADHLGRLGIAAEPAEVSTSAQAAAALLAGRLSAGAEVLVVGTDSLAAEIRAVGLRPVREATTTVAAVVQGHAPDTGWPELARACVAVRAGALWVACNVDATLPSERGELPGNGAMVAALRTATGAEPEVAGKPRAPLLRTAAESAGATDPLVVGDRPDTDIAGARAAGYRSLAVLTGVATPADLLGLAPHERPEHLADDLAVLTGEVPAGALRIGDGAATPDDRAPWRIADDGAALTVTAVPGAHPDPTGVDLLRRLCARAWRSGTTAVRGGDATAAATLVALRLA